MTDTTREALKRAIIAALKNKEEDLFCKTMGVSAKNYASVADEVIAALSGNQVNAAQQDKDASRWREYLRQQYTEYTCRSTANKRLAVTFDEYKANADRRIDIVASEHALDAAIAAKQSTD